MRCLLIACLFSAVSYGADVEFVTGQKRAHVEARAYVEHLGVKYDDSSWLDEDKPGTPNPCSSSSGAGTEKADETWFADVNGLNDTANIWAEAESHVNSGGFYCQAKYSVESDILTKSAGHEGYTGAKVSANTEITLKAKKAGTARMFWQLVANEPSRGATNDNSHSELTLHCTDSFGNYVVASWDEDDEEWDVYGSYSDQNGTTQTISLTVTGNLNRSWYVYSTQLALNDTFYLRTKVNSGDCNPPYSVEHKDEGGDGFDVTEAGNASNSFVDID